MTNNQELGKQDARSATTHKATAIENTTNSLHNELLQKADKKTTSSLVERMLDDQQDKVNPAIRIKNDGTVDL